MKDVATLHKKRILWNSFLRFQGIEVRCTSTRGNEEFLSHERRMHTTVTLRQRAKDSGLRINSQLMRNSGPVYYAAERAARELDIHNMSVCLLTEHYADIYTEKVAKNIAEYTRRRSYIRGKKSEALHRYSPRLSERLRGQAFYSRGVGDPVQRTESDASAPE